MKTVSSPRGRAFTPTMLNSYVRCPQQYFLKYEERQRVVSESSTSLACGSVVHDLLATYLDPLRRGQSFPTRIEPEHLRAPVEARLSRALYHDQQAWATDVGKIVEWISWALASFDRSAQVLAVERWLEYGFPGNSETPPFRLRAKVDLVLRHADGSIEHLDWKSGSTYEIDRLQNVISRIVVGQTYRAPRILSSTAFLANEATRTDELTRDAVKEVWEDIKGLARAILGQPEWLPVSNALCPWCPYYGNGCALYPHGEAQDTTTDWLEGAA